MSETRKGSLLITDLEKRYPKEAKVCTRDEAALYLRSPDRTSNYVIRQRTDNPQPNEVTISYLGPDGALRHTQCTVSPDNNDFQFQDNDGKFVKFDLHDKNIIKPFQSTSTNTSQAAAASTPNTESKPTVMVISTQVSAGLSASAQGVSLGGTGKAIATLGAGLANMHHDKRFDEEDKKKFKDNLSNNGWLVITGHGGAGNQELGGIYQAIDTSGSELTKKEIDVEHSAKDYVDHVMKSGQLKSGDTINVLLYACYGGAKGKDGGPSFAEQLAGEFAKHGIGSSIVASVKPVGRIGEFDPYQGDIISEQLVFRAEAKDIRVVKTTLDEDGLMLAPKTTSPNETFLITKDGLGFRSQLKGMELDTTVAKQALNTSTPQPFSRSRASPRTSVDSTNNMRASGNTEMHQAPPPRETSELILEAEKLTGEIRKLLSQLSDPLLNNNKTAGLMKEELELCLKNLDAKLTNESLPTHSKELQIEFRNDIDRSKQIIARAHQHAAADKHHDSAPPSLGTPAKSAPSTNEMNFDWIKAEKKFGIQQDSNKEASFTNTSGKKISVVGTDDRGCDDFYPDAVKKACEAAIQDRIQLLSKPYKNLNEPQQKQFLELLKPFMEDAGKNSQYKSNQLSKPACYDILASQPVDSLKAIIKDCHKNEKSMLKGKVEHDGSIPSISCLRKALNIAPTRKECLRALLGVEEIPHGKAMSAKPDKPFQPDDKFIKDCIEKQIQSVSTLSKPEATLAARCKT